MNINPITVENPKILSEERLELILVKLYEISKSQRTTIDLSQVKNETISTAAYAVRKVLLAAATEHQHEIKVNSFDATNQAYNKLEALLYLTNKRFL